MRRILWTRRVALTRRSHLTLCLGILIDIEDVMSSIKMGSRKAAWLKTVDLIIWDEVSMQHKSCFEVVHRLLSEIKGYEPDSLNTPLFSGIPAIFGGDFAQILPVVPGGNRGQVVNACLQRSWIWKKLKRVHLTANMRLRDDPQDDRWLAEATAFRSWLSCVPYDRDLYDDIEIPANIQQLWSVDKLIEKIYLQDLLESAVNQRHASPFKDRCILTTKNSIAES